MAKVFFEPVKKLLQVITRTYDFFHNVKHRPHISSCNGIGYIEKEIGVYDTQSVNQGVVRNFFSTKRYGLIQYGESISQGAVSLSRDEQKRGIIDHNSLGFTDRSQVCNNIGCCDPSEIESLAARLNRCRHFVWFRGCENKQDMGRRFFKSFKQGIKSLRGEHVYLIDDVHFHPATLRRDSYRFPDVACVVYLVVGRRIDFDDIQIAALLERNTRLTYPTWFRRVGPIL